MIRILFFLLMPLYTLAKTTDSLVVEKLTLADTIFKLKKDDPTYVRHDSLMALEMRGYQQVEDDTFLLNTGNNKS